MSEAPSTIRVHLVDDAGVITDSGQNLRLSDFAGLLPVAGDRVVQPDPSGGADHRMLDVVGRIFNPRGLNDYVALICRVRAPMPGEVEVMPDDEA